MADEQNVEIKRPRATVGVYIFNENGEMGFIRSPKWGGLLVPPGGHIEYGETWADAAVREAKEETGLDVEKVELVTVINMVEPEEFTTKAHFVGTQVRAQVVSGSVEKLDGIEATELVWKKPVEMANDETVEPRTRQLIKEFFVNKTANEDYKAGWQRAQADYQNLKREVEEQKKDWAAWSEVRILEEFIPVYNNFKKAMEFTPPELEGDSGKAWLNWKRGVEFIMQQFAGILKAHQVEEIKTVGEMFDPTLHESMVEEVSQAPEHSIIREITPGYTMKGKVVQVAKVVVAKKAE